MNETKSPSVYFESDPRAEIARPHILVLTNMFPNPGQPFLGVFVRQQVASLREKGLGVDILFVNGSAGKLNYLKGVVAFRRQLRRRRYDLIHAHYVFSALIARLQTGIPVVNTFHSGEFYSGKLEYLLSRLIAPRVDANIVVSSPLKSFLGSREAGDAHVIPCGVDLDRFYPTPMAEARKEIGLPTDKKLVLFAAARRPEKRFDLVEQASDILKRRRPEAELIVLSGEPPERVPLYMNACDVLVLASDKEGSPQVIKEAMACNMPIVSTAVGDVPGVFGGAVGCYVTSQDPEEIATKLEAALDRDSRTDGYEHVSHLGLGGVAASIMEVYDKVLKSQLPREPDKAPAAGA